MCADMLERRRTQLGTAAVVRQYLSSHALGQLPSLAQVATLTSTGERTLKRRLQREGTSFRTLVAEVRADFAAELVREQKLPLSVVADRLGYADLSSFSQAFKRWHGVAPMVYRQKQR
jgi:AraC-like DNA-binding protein